MVETSPPKSGDQRGRARRLWPARQEGLDVDGERVALLGALHRDGAVLRVDEGHGQDLPGQVVLGPDRAAEGVARLDRDDVARHDAQDRGGAGALDVVVGALRRLGQAVAGSCSAPRDPAACHVRRLEPAHPCISPVRARRRQASRATRARGHGAARAGAGPTGRISGSGPRGASPAAAGAPPPGARPPPGSAACRASRAAARSRP